MQFKRLKSYFVVILCFSFLFIQPKETTSAMNKIKSNVEANMEFKIKYIKEEKEGVFNYSLDKISYKPLSGAQVIVIDNISGEIITSGYSDNKGIWKTQITVNKDHKFVYKDLGTVTTITVADGFNETIHFNVPVSEFETLQSSDLIILHAINPSGRNEPHFEGARFHRFTVFEMLDYYAKRIGLVRQPIFNNYETPPWGLGSASK